MNTAKTAHRVLVVGGAGFIGSHTCIELVQSGYEPVVVDTFDNSHEEVIERIESLCGRKLEVHRADVRDTDVMRDILGSDIQSVIHFAALKAVGESVERPLAYYDLNVGGTVSLLKAMRSAGVATLVFSGSCSIFGDAEVIPITETSPIRPTNPYANTKAFCETVLSDTCNVVPDLSATSLRYFNPIGAHPSGQLGEDPVGTPSNLLPFAMQVAIGRREALNVFGDDYPTPDGTCVRDYIHVVDVAAAHVRAIDTFHRSAGFRAFNLGTGQGTSVYDLVDRVRSISGRTVDCVVQPRRPGDVPELVADPSLAGEILKWNCRFDLNDMVSDAWRFQSSNPGGYAVAAAATADCTQD